MEVAMPEFVTIAGRAFLSFLLLLTLARILGKKQISHLTFFDYIVGIVIGDITASIAVDPSMKFTNGLVGLVVYTLLSLIIAFGAIKSFKFRELVESSPSILIKDGEIMEKNLSKNRLTFDDLMNGLRMKDAFNISEVELAMIETDGQISVMKKPKYQSLTPNDISKCGRGSCPFPSYYRWHTLRKHLKYLGYTNEWLLEEIKKQGANKIEDVFLAQINSTGSVYVDLYNDKKSVQQVKQKPNLTVKLRRVQADIESIASQTKDKNAKKMYFYQSKELENIIKKLNPYLQE